MTQSIDTFFSRRYDRDHYHCSHFVVDVAENALGIGLSGAFKTFLLPPEKQEAPLEIKHKFKRIEQLQENGDLVVFHKFDASCHVGIFYKRKILHLAFSGVQHVSLDILAPQFKRHRFYRYVNNYQSLQ